MTWFEIFVIIQKDLAFTYINLPFWELLRLPKMATKLPKERDFDPYGGGLDEQCAWRNFGGLTLDEAYHKFESAPEVYQDLTWDKSTT